MFRKFSDIGNSPTLQSTVSGYDAVPFLLLIQIASL